MGIESDRLFSDKGSHQSNEKIFNITNYQEDANQNHNEISPDTCQNIIKKATNSKGW